MTSALAPPGRDVYHDLVARALAEDIGHGDRTTELTIDAELRARGTLLAKSRLVVAGLDVVTEAFHQLDSSSVVEVRWGDGAVVDGGEEIAVVTGVARALLTAERTALNFLQRLSGIAMLTRQFVDAADGKILILDTRKTTPTFRQLEKYAVRCGGGTNHRERLDDGILIKDNHKRLAGGVGVAVQRVLAAHPDVPVEVEVESLEELDEALAAGAQRILLDNFTTYDIREAIARGKDRARFEISGGITLGRIPQLATTGATWVSIGALTHSAPAADISFEIDMAS